MRAAVLVALVALGAAECAAAVDHETVHFFPLPMSDAFLDEFERDIASGHFPNPWSKSGPNVTWTEGCVVTLEVAIVLPDFPDGMVMTQAERARMDRAVEILKAHELGFMAIWRDWAEEVQRQGCVTVPRDRWQAQVDAENQRTNYGYIPGFAAGWDR